MSECILLDVDDLVPTSDSTTLTRKNDREKPMKKKLPTILLVSGLLFDLSGCHGGQEKAEFGVPQKAITKKNVATLIVGEMFKPSAEGMRSQVKKAIKDLADKLDVPSDKIKVIRAESVTWRDGSLGCLQKGMSYTQALVLGTEIVLLFGNTEYEYHSGSRGEPFYCANPRLPLPVKMAE